MKKPMLCIRLDKDMERLLAKVSRQTGRNRSEVVRDVLRRQLRLTQFEAIRRRMMPFAEARGRVSTKRVSEHPFFGMSRSSRSVEEEMSKLRGGIERIPKKKITKEKRKNRKDIAERHDDYAFRK